MLTGAIWTVEELRKANPMSVENVGRRGFS
jgi:hypothetical protein